MKYNAVIGKVGRNWFGFFPDFPGVFIIAATTRAALMKKLGYNLSEYITFHQGPFPKAKIKKLSDIDPEELEDIQNPELIAVEVADINPISLEVGRLIDSSDLTPAQIAAKAGTTTSALSRMRNPRYTRHNLETLRRLASAVGARVSMKFERN
jgi:predicted RNase H-like HicB family nuclease